MRVSSSQGSNPIGVIATVRKKHRSRLYARQEYSSKPIIVSLAGRQRKYASRNGIVCRPGTYFKGADGLRHLCQ